MKFTGTIAILLFLFTAPGLLPAQAPAWQPLGPFGGLVTGLTADSSKAGVLYATAGPAGVFKSTDRGGTWRNVLLGDTQQGNMAVDPTRPDTLYAIAYPGVVWKSLDAGAHWTQSSPGLSPVQSSFTVTVDPARPSRVYLGAGNAVWRSLDGGASWQQANNGLPVGIPQSQVRKLVAVRRPEGTAFAGLADGLYRTTNGAGSWKRLAQGLPAARVVALLASPADPRTLYVLFEGGGGFFKTTNGGESWQPAVKPPAGTELITTLAVDARSARTLYAGLSSGRILRSVDGARRWSMTGRTPAPFPSSLTPDPFAARVLYTGLDTLQAGVFRSDDGGATWQRRNQGYDAIGFGGLGVVPDHPEQLWIAGYGIYRSGNGGRRWIPASVPEGIPYLPDSGGAFAAASATTAYASTLQIRPTVVFLSKTEDGGASWDGVRSFLGRPFPLTGSVQLRLAPSAPMTLYGLEVPSSLPRTPLTLKRTTDGGVSWEDLPTGVFLDCGAGDLVVAPSTASVLYAGGAASTPPGTCSAPSARVVRSRDGGTTWTDVSAGLPAGFVARLTVDPVDPDTLYAGLGIGDPPNVRGEGVWKSTDGGATWNRAGTELNGKTVTALLATSTPGQVYAALDDHRVFRSDDGGESWDEVSAGLAAEHILVLAADPSNPDRVYAATSQGIWVLAE